MCNIFQLHIRLAVLVAVFNLVASCLITNCPRGGKRDGTDTSLRQKDLTSCTPCGPNSLGICIGRDICCGRHIGCLMATPHTRICRRVTEFKESCLSAFSSCGEDGLCVAKDLCCTKSDCKMDTSCKGIPFFERDDIPDPYPSNRFLVPSVRYPLRSNLWESGQQIIEPYDPKEETVLSNFNYRTSDS